MANSSVDGESYLNAQLAALNWAAKIHQAA
jgi:hypothetical protein